MDPETAALILQLQIQDSDELFSSCEGKGKGIEGVLSDTQIALQIYGEELQRNATIIADQTMTRSLTRACKTDGNILALSFSQERLEARDRQVALRLGDRSAPPILTDRPANEDEEPDDEILEKLNALYISSLTSPGAESSKWAASRPSKIPKRHCTACSEPFFSQLGRAPCRHEYCRSCLQDLFTASMIDDTLFPPRCSRQPITPTTDIRIYLTPSIYHRYSAKKIEFATPNRTYCSAPLCSSLIRDEYVVEEKATCQVCKTVTCTICKGSEYNGDCPEDEALKMVLETARENQWQRCYNCYRLVELDTGCNHMTFVFHSKSCGERWNTCCCEQCDEHRLYARAEVVVARQPALVNQPPEQRQTRLATVLRDLRDRHECDHGSWRWVRGPHECEECRHDLPDYIFQCRQCHIQACNRCRRNRL
ncbi:IBR domain-containing protein [Cadophora sp. MPI-SDFR-AT-0126]|nr:IBR domain-containing protein [Leotiomycetes sp. MPI-SDFR-AT-0126]